MTLKTAINKAFMIVRNPEREFINLEKRTFEKVLEDFAKLVLLSGLFAGIANFIYSLLNALYLQIFKNVSIEYMRLVNYSLGVSTSTFFFYLFAGSILMFVISLLIKTIFYRWTAGMKLTQLLSIVFYASSPVLLFGWISSKLAIALLVWTAVLIATGIIIKNEVSANKLKLKPKRKTSKNK